MDNTVETAKLITGKLRKAKAALCFLAFNRGISREFSNVQVKRLGVRNVGRGEEGKGLELTKEKR